MLKKSIILLVIAFGLFLLVKILFLQKNETTEVEETLSEEMDSEYFENKILKNAQAGFQLTYPGSYTFVSDDTSIYSIGSLSRSPDRIDILSNSFSNLYSQDSFRIYGSEDLEQGQTLSWGSFGKGPVECSYEACEEYSDQFVVLLQLSSIKEGNLALSTTLYLNDGKNMHTLEDMMDAPVIQDMYAIAKSFELYEYQELFEGYEYLLVRDGYIFQGTCFE